jgi:DNA-binding CsgD family transcriptional regulator
VVLANKNFRGKINNKNVYDFLKEIMAHQELNQQERIDLVKNVLYTQNGFLDEYFEEVFEQKDIENNVNATHVKLCINKEDYLSHEINVCKVIELISEYILFAPDAERINKKTKYNFYSKDKFEDKISKDVLIDDITQQHNDIDSETEDIIDFLIRIGSNYKKTIKQKIVVKDIHDIEELSDYQFMVDYLSDELKKEKEKNKNSKNAKRLGKLIHDLRDDQLLCKDYKRGTIYFKQTLDDSTHVDYDMFDFTNNEHVISLLKFRPSSDFSEDLNCIVYDLQTLLKKVELNKLEKQVLKFWRVDDENQKTIAEQLGISHMKVNRTLNSIAKKIGIAYSEDYNDWYYLHVEKGAYKICSRCQETKLTSEFGKDARNKDSLACQCKKCSKK